MSYSTEVGRAKVGWHGVWRGSFQKSGRGGGRPKSGGGVGRGKKKFGSGGYEVKWGKNEEKQ